MYILTLNLGGVSMWHRSCIAGHGFRIRVVIIALIFFLLFHIEFKYKKSFWKKNFSQLMYVCLVMQFNQFFKVFFYLN